MVVGELDQADLEGKGSVVGGEVMAGQRKVSSGSGSADAKAGNFRAKTASVERKSPSLLHRRTTSRLPPHHDFAGTSILVLQTSRS